MNTTPDRRFEEALADLAELAKRRRKPGHHHARALLVSLGELVLEGTAGFDEAATAARVAAAVEPFEEAWRQAADVELQMACTEHCQSVDPRYLDLPRYDFAYTIEARERLEARLSAAAVLGIEVPEVLLDQVADADSRLAPYLSERESGSAN